MRAGAMRETLIFSQHTQTQSTTGSVIKSWIDVYSCRGMIKKSSPVFDKDGVEAKEEYQGINLIFIVRMANVINDNLRIKYNGYKYEILLIEPNYSDKTLLIQARRINE